MTWFCPFYAHAGWAEYARLYPLTYQLYRLSLCTHAHVRAEITDFMRCYDMGHEL